MTMPLPGVCSCVSTDIYGNCKSKLVVKCELTEVQGEINVIHQPKSAILIGDKLQCSNWILPKVHGGQGVHIQRCVCVCPQMSSTSAWLGTDNVQCTYG